jgi:deoxyribose-phosphate aldolase
LPDATRDQIETLCAEAREHGFATVCVNPAWVRLCADRLRGSETRVCTVAGFPLGATTAEAKAYEAERAVAEGAAEVDMVMNIGALKSEDYRLVERDIAGVVAACRRGGALSEVIIEAALLTDDEKVKACVIARRLAPTSSRLDGLGPGGATAADVALMLGRGAGEGREGSRRSGIWGGPGDDRGRRRPDQRAWGEDRQEAAALGPDRACYLLRERAMYASAVRRGSRPSARIRTSSW